MLLGVCEVYVGVKYVCVPWATFDLLSWYRLVVNCVRVSINVFVLVYSQQS